MNEDAKRQVVAELFAITAIPSEDTEAKVKAIQVWADGLDSEESDFLVGYVKEATDVIHDIIVGLIRGRSVEAITDHYAERLDAVTNLLPS